jgi:SAD/SRA domain
VVVSNGGYASVDKDLGDTIIYSAPGAFETKSKTPEKDTRGAKCLLMSHETKLPIRVIRGQSNWYHAPSVGYRYDGLYQVEEKGEGKNNDGGVYVWFKLVRQTDINQKVIDTKKPNYKQRQQEARVSRGY